MFVLGLGGLLGNELGCSIDDYIATDRVIQRFWVIVETLTRLRWEDSLGRRWDKVSIIFNPEGALLLQLCYIGFILSKVSIQLDELKNLF